MTKSAIWGMLLTACVLLPLSMMGQETQSAPDQARNNANADRELTLRVRRDVSRDRGLSKNGHGVKILTHGGKVTLEGPVSSDDEKKAIVQIAKKDAGSGNVVDQLTVPGDRR